MLVPAAIKRRIAGNAVKFSSLLVAGLLLVFGGTVGGAENDADTIRALRAESNEAIARHDIEAVQSFLDADYVITISTGVIERSRDEFSKGMASLFERYPDVVYVRTPSKITLSDAYPLAIEHGTWTGFRTDKNGKLEHGGEYTAAWRKADGTWRIYSELFVGLYCRGADC